MAELKIEGRPMEFTNEELKKSADEQKEDEIVQQTRKTVHEFEQVSHVAGEKLDKEMENARVAKALGLEEDAVAHVEKAHQIYNETKEDVAEKGKWHETLKKIFEMIKRDNKPGMALVFTEGSTSLGPSGDDFVTFTRFLEKKFKVIDFRGGYFQQISETDGTTTRSYGDGKYIRLPGTDIFLLIQFEGNKLTVLKLNNENISKLENYQK